MIYGLGFLGLFISLFSPAAGVLFLIPATGRIMIENSQFKINFFLSWFAICVVFYFASIIDKVQVANLLFGSGFSLLLLFYMIKKEYGLELIFMSLLGLNTVFIAIRQYLFADYILSQYTESVDATINLFSSRFQEGSEQYQLFLEMIDLSKDFYLNYSPGVWISTMVLCMMFGYYFLTRKTEQLESMRFYQTHLYVIYSMILALVVAMFWEDYKLIAINYIIALIPLFLMQGLAVIKIKIGKWFESSKLLLFIAILSLILNPYIILFITVIGLFDCWFDFRSLSQEEKKEEGEV